jgi:DNA-binding Lrp family transcriptional regulator
MAVSAYILIQTEVGTAGDVAKHVRELAGVLTAENLIGPYDVIALVEANNVDELGRLVAGRVQMINGITRTTTCEVVHL